ncbi:hypothetical protein AAFF_G00274900 [Aldrovandia affinis]|uniref:Uncharacterized protein n=1 Tax=Aldrovandia affinis TaxID=143900 RepID=A0AAD7SS47_9TELE|nr:hypothetical protein AAFF_G00274900 [Aldrovandia affinis]
MITVNYRAPGLLRSTLTKCEAMLQSACYGRASMEPDVRLTPPPLGALNLNQRPADKTAVPVATPSGRWAPPAMAHSGEVLCLADIACWKRRGLFLARREV